MPPKRRRRGGKASSDAKRPRSAPQSAPQPDDTDDSETSSIPEIIATPARAATTSTSTITASAARAAAAAPVDNEDDGDDDNDAEDEHINGTVRTSMSEIEKTVCRTWKTAPRSELQFVMVHCHDARINTPLKDRCPRTLQILQQVTRDPLTVPYIAGAYLTSRKGIEKELQQIFGGTISVVSYLHSDANRDDFGLSTDCHWALLKRDFQWLPVVRRNAQPNSGYTYTTTVEYCHDTVYNPPHIHAPQQHLQSTRQSSAAARKSTHVKTVGQCIARYDRGQQNIDDHKKNHGDVEIDADTAKTLRDGYSDVTWTLYTQMRKTAVVENKLTDAKWLAMTPLEYKQKYLKVTS
jgi:hypothetical protein